MMTLPGITRDGPRHILNAQQFEPAWLFQLFQRASELQKEVKDQQRHHTLGNLLFGNLLFNVFYEASTRTRMSFAAAAQHMGMEVVSTENAREFSSAAKGESLEDTIRVLCEYYPAVIVLRHHEDGGADRAASVSSVPIINAGDGGGQHPTQALLDLYTIQQRLERASNLHVVIGGDLAKGRTARSLAYLLAKFEGNHISFVAPPELSIAQDVKDYLDRHGVSFVETQDLHSVLPRADVVYWTRTQTERHENGGVGDAYIIDLPELELMQPHAILMHPLPRIKEITTAVDDDPRAVYFAQAGNGMFIRMALLEWVLGYW